MKPKPLQNDGCRKNSPEIATNHMESESSGSKYTKKCLLTPAAEAEPPNRLTGLHPWKNTSRCWLDHFITAPEQENASIKWPDQVTPLRKHQSMLNGPLYTLPAPSIPSQFKAVLPQSMLFTPWISIFVWLLVSFGFDVLWGSPSMRSVIFPKNLNVARQLYTQSCVCFQRRD